MSVRKKLISNTFYLFLNWFSVTFFSLLYWLLLGKFFSPADYGIISTSTQFSLFLAAVSFLGLNWTTIKLLPEFIQKKKMREISYLINFSLKTFIFSSSLFVILFLILSSLNFIKLPHDAILITVLTVPTIVFANYLANILYGFQQMKKFASLNFIGQLTKVVVTSIFIILSFHWLNEELAQRCYLGPLIAFFFSYFVMILVRLRKVEVPSQKPKKVDKKLVMKYAIPAFIVVILRQLFTNTHFIILSSLTTQEITGYFAVAFKIASFVMVIPNVLTSALFPLTSQLSADKSSKRKQAELVSSTLRYSLFLSIPILLIILFFSKYAILLFAKEDYLPATEYLPSLLISSLFLGVSLLLLSTLYAIKKPEEYRNIYLVATFTYLPMAFILTKEYSASGLAYAYLSVTFLFFALSAWRVKKHLKLTFNYKNFFKIVGASFLSLTFLWIIKPFIPNILLAIPVAILAVLIYLFVLLKLRFYSEEDLLIIDFFIERVPRKMKLIKNLAVKVRNYLLKNIS